METWQCKQADCCTIHTSQFTQGFVSHSHLPQKCLAETESVQNYTKIICKKKNHDSHTGTNPHLKKEIVGDHVITEVINNSLHFVLCDPSYKQNQSSRRINKPRSTMSFVSSGSSTVLNPVSYPIMAVSLIQTIFSNLRVKSHTPLTRSSLIISPMQKF